MASDVESKCKVRTFNQVSKDLELTMANETMSKAIDEMSATVKDQEMFGRAMSLEKKEAAEASDEIATSLERRLKSKLETAKRDRSCMFESRRIEFVKKKVAKEAAKASGSCLADWPDLPESTFW